MNKMFDLCPKIIFGTCLGMCVCYLAILARDMYVCVPFRNKYWTDIFREYIKGTIQIAQCFFYSISYHAAYKRPTAQHRPSLTMRELRLQFPRGLSADWELHTHHLIALQICTGPGSNHDTLLKSRQVKPLGYHS